jgi:hypothetical protein
MYVSRMTACWQRYNRKASLDQHPRDFTVSKDIPQRRYSSVVNILYVVVQIM